MATAAMTLSVKRGVATGRPLFSSKSEPGRHITSMSFRPVHCVS